MRYRRCLYAFIHPKSTSTAWIWYVRFNSYWYFFEWIDNLISSTGGDFEIPYSFNILEVKKFIQRNGYETKEERKKIKDKVKTKQSGSTILLYVMVGDVI